MNSLYLILKNFKFLKSNNFDFSDFTIIFQFLFCINPFIIKSSAQPQALEQITGKPYSKASFATIPQVSFNEGNINAVADS